MPFHWVNSKHFSTLDKNMLATDWNPQAMGCWRGENSNPKYCNNSQPSLVSPAPTCRPCQRLWVDKVKVLFSSSPSEHLDNHWIVGETEAPVDSRNAPKPQAFGNLEPVSTLGWRTAKPYTTSPQRLQGSPTPSPPGTPTTTSIPPHLSEGGLRFLYTQAEQWLWWPARSLPTSTF